MKVPAWIQCHSFGCDGLRDGDMAGEGNWYWCSEKNSHAIKNKNVAVGVQMGHPQPPNKTKQPGSVNSRQRRRRKLVSIHAQLLQFAQDSLEAPAPCSPGLSHAQDAITKLLQLILIRAVLSTSSSQNNNLPITWQNSLIAEAHDATNPLATSFKVIEKFEKDNSEGKHICFWTDDVPPVISLL